MTQLALYLICHHGETHEAELDAHVIQHLGEKGMPITYFLSGIELDTFLRERDRIQHNLWFDPVGALKSDLFINPRFGRNNPYQPEMGVMPYHHVPLVLPWHQDAWGDYFNAFLRHDIQASIGTAQYGFGKTPVTLHPPDGVYAPAAAHAVRSCGFDTVVVSGEFLGDNKGAKGGVYWASDLRHLMRTNDVQLQSFDNPKYFIDAVMAYSHDNWLPIVTVGCDIDEFNGMRGRSAYDGIAFLCCLADEAYRQNLPLLNCNAASYLSPRQRDIKEIWSWNNVYAMINGDGGLDWIDPERNGLVSHTIKLAAQRIREGWYLDGSLTSLEIASDIALRNKGFCYNEWLTDLYDQNIKRVRELLQG